MAFLVLLQPSREPAQPKRGPIPSQQWSSGPSSNATDGGAGNRPHWESGVTMGFLGPPKKMAKNFRCGKIGVKWPQPYNKRHVQQLPYRMCCRWLGCQSNLWHKPPKQWGENPKHCQYTTEIGPQAGHATTTGYHGTCWRVKPTNLISLSVSCHCQVAPPQRDALHLCGVPEKHPTNTKAESRPDDGGKPLLERQSSRCSLSLSNSRLVMFFVSTSGCLEKLFFPRRQRQRCRAQCVRGRAYVLTGRLARTFARGFTHQRWLLNGRPTKALKWMLKRWKQLNVLLWGPNPSIPLQLIGKFAVARLAEPLIGLALLDGVKVNTSSLNDLEKSGIYLVSSKFGFTMQYLKMTFCRFLRDNLAPGQETLSEEYYDYEY